MKNTRLSTRDMETLNDGIEKLIDKNCERSCMGCPYAPYKFCEVIMVIDKILASDKETVSMFK